MGVEAVIDKDHASALLARDIGADALILATDAPAARTVRFGQPDQRAMDQGHPDAIERDYISEFAVGSMLPKILAACDFARATGKPATIGALTDIEAMLVGTAGTRVSSELDDSVNSARRTRGESLRDWGRTVPFGVHSEVGKLRKVMVHRPGWSMHD